jgi:hypothetical protein
MGTEFRITFPEASSAERSRLVSKLQDALQNVNGVQTVVLRERQDTQDPGTILSVVLGAPAVVYTVKALAAWLVRNNQSRARLTRPDGTVVFECHNMQSEDIAKAIEALNNVIKPS